MATLPKHDPSPMFVAACNQWAQDVLVGRVYPTPAQILALRSAVAAVARKCRASDISYDESGFLESK